MASLTDILIIGAGPAGLTAAIYAARAGVPALVFERSLHGGQMALAGTVDNYPGLPGSTGADLVNRLYKHATSQGVQLCYEEVLALELAGGVKTVTTHAGSYRGRALIFTAGARRRLLGCPGEAEFTGRGVSYCATCDAAFFKGKTVASVGGGNTALGDALFLSNHCKQVYLIHRRTAFRGQKALQNAVFARPNIQLVTPATVKAIIGGDVVTQVLLDTPRGEKTLPVDGVFVAVGLTPESGLLKGKLPLADGYIPAGEDCATAVPGVWAAGDVRTKPLRQIVTAAADGAVAAVAAAEYCNALDEGPQ